MNLKLDFDAFNILPQGLAIFNEKLTLIFLNIALT